MHRVSAKYVLFMTLVLAVPISPVFSQERPGIRPFITPPENCYVSDPVEPESIYSFLRVQILALSLAQKGEWANARTLETKGGAKLDEMDKAIAGLREERIQDICASFVVAYYAESKNTTMATVAKFLAQAYDKFAQMSNQMLGINLQKTLSRLNGPSPQRQLSALMEERQTLLQDMELSLNLSLDLLVDTDRKDADGKPDHFILQKAEIRDLLEYLYSRFPTLKDIQGSRPSGDFVKQAASIQAFLTSSYKPADLP
jgi:hypothetical protein